MGATYPGHEIVKKPSIRMVFLCLHVFLMIIMRPVVGKNHPNIINWPSFWSKIFMEPFSGTPDSKKHMLSCCAGPTAFMYFLTTYYNHKIFSCHLVKHLTLDHPNVSPFDGYVGVILTLV